MWPLAFWDRGFESRRVYGCLSLEGVVCCQVEVSATGRSFVQRSPTECDREASILRRYRPTGVVGPSNERKTYVYGVPGWLHSVSIYWRK